MIIVGAYVLKIKNHVIISSEYGSKIKNNYYIY